MQEQDELKDIILNKTPKANNTKKILLTIATFAIILIIAIVVMNQMEGSKPGALPQVPQKKIVEIEEVVDEPEYIETPVPMVEESIENTSELIEKTESQVQNTTETAQHIPDGKDETDRIADNVFEEPEIIEEPHYTPKKAKPAPKKTAVKKVTPVSKKLTKATRPNGKYSNKKGYVKAKSGQVPTQTGSYYIQVGSFSKYAPSKLFLDKITDRGFTYTFHKVTKNATTTTKVLVGPFKTSGAAREALSALRKSVESGAFLTKI